MDQGDSWIDKNSHIENRAIETKPVACRFATFSPQLPSPNRAFSHRLCANIKERSVVV